MHTPYMQREINNGEQKLYKFANGYGASVVRHSFSYGNEIGLWELAITKFDNEVEWHICYETEITDDVIGNLSEEEVESLLVRIQSLDK